MSAVLAAVLAAAAVVVLAAAPSAGALRLSGLQAPDGSRPAPTRWTAIPVAAASAVVVAGPVAGGLAVVGLLLAERAVAGHRRGQAAAAERAGAAAACRVLAAELRAGRSPSGALAAAAEVATGPAARALRSAATTAQLGGEVPAALLAEQVSSAVGPLLRGLSACWTVCEASGSGLADAVQRLEEGLRSEQELRRTVDAELAGPRATALLLAGLPVAGLLMAAGLGADPQHVLLETPLGVVCLAAGLLLDALGLLWTQRLVTRARPPEPP